jgi:hypothetical protein
VWKFSRRSLVFDHGRITPVDEESFAIMGSDGTHGRANQLDPSWQMPLLAGLAG